MAGPLSGIRIIEMAGIGPGPFCGMLLSDMGAEVIRIDRTALKDASGTRTLRLMERGRRSVGLDLKQPEAIEIALKLIDSADALFEGFRPGVMERLGLGPKVCLVRNPKLVYGRMTGWGQTGPLAQAAGHDINYIAISGALAGIGTKAQPLPPLNLVGDFGGGAMYLAMGLLAGILNARSTGQGQVVDAAMTDGAASLMTMFYGLQAGKRWSTQRESNFLDGGAHFYGTYECADGKFVAIGSIEPQFYALLLEKAGLTDAEWSAQWDSNAWSALKAKLGAVFQTKTRAQWCALMEGTDVCFAPVMDLREAPQHPHNLARQAFVDVGGELQPAPAPRFSATPSVVQGPAVAGGTHTREVLAELGFSVSELDRLTDAKTI